MGVQEARPANSLCFLFSPSLFYSPRLQKYLLFLLSSSKGVELQERLSSNHLPLKNGGTKIAARIAYLSSQIGALKASLPIPTYGMRDQNARQASLMVPINSCELKV